MNAWLEQYLCPWTASQPTSWSKILPIAEFAHNLWRHDVARKSPHELLFGMKPQMILKHLESPTPAAEVHLKLLDEARQMAQKLLAYVQNRKDDRKITEMKVGDQVWLEGRNLSVAGNRKLSPKRYGPFPITKKIGSVAYQLQLLASMKIHDIFHMDLLLPYKEMEAYGMPFTRPPPIINSKEEYEIEAILDARWKGRGCQLQYLMHWKGYPHSDDSWIAHKDLHAPELLAEFMHSDFAMAGRPTV